MQYIWKYVVFIKAEIQKSNGTVCFSRWYIELGCFVIMQHILSVFRYTDAIIAFHLIHQFLLADVTIVMITEFNDGSIFHTLSYIGAKISGYFLATLPNTLRDKCSWDYSHRTYFYYSWKAYKVKTVERKCLKYGAHPCLTIVPRKWAHLY